MKTLNTAIAAMLVSPWIACSHARAADIDVDITGITEQKGEILVALFNQAEGWPRKGTGTTRARAQVGKVRVSFTDLPEGDYAVSVIHDRNSNGKLDANLIGMPTEPYGFSNDVAGKFGPPSFDQAKFRLDMAHQSISVRLK
ncbi:MAG: DUF2141 domain-containing protein [Betaproteobacteria bacterium]